MADVDDALPVFLRGRPVTSQGHGHSWPVYSTHSKVSGSKNGFSSGLPHTTLFVYVYHKTFIAEPEGWRALAAAAARLPEGDRRLLAGAIC